MKDIKVIKRDGRKVDFDATKIRIAIGKANAEVPPVDQMSSIQMDAVTEMVVKQIFENGHDIGIEDIQELVIEAIQRMGAYRVATNYTVYRYKRQLARHQNTTDEDILKLIGGANKEMAEENSNKDTSIASTQRDYIAGIVSRDVTSRLLLPEDVSQAHKDGVLHFHDADYFIQPIFNCCLLDLGDMLEKGIVVNGKMIETPKSFQVACTVTTQIIACVASNQYGGQSVDICHLGKFLRYSRDKYRRKITQALGETELNSTVIEKLVDERVRTELSSGIQTIQYQLNTLMTTNGQSPFVTLFLYLRDDDPYIEENAMIIEEILKQRIEGIKNEAGVYITPAFPKLVYVLDENNCLKGGKYDYLTELAARCSAKRMYPDYISAKKMRENYEGNVFSPMGCRSFLSPWKDENGNYKFEGRFNQGVVSINLPQIGLAVHGDMDQFWTEFDRRLELCKKALMCRHKALLGVKSDVSPIHWQYGAIARLKKGETIDKYLFGGYSTISLGYIGLYELTYLMTGQSHTQKEGLKFALQVMQHMKDKVLQWKKETNIGFALYGTPAESLCYRFARIDQAKYGIIENVTDKGYYTNSYHVDVREKIDAFSKLLFESQFQSISTGGCISYVELPNMQTNLDAVIILIRFIYDNIQYAEFNTKNDFCQVCGYSGEIVTVDGPDGNPVWECPVCHNRDQHKMNVVRRTCGYLGERFWNVGKTKEIQSRVLHL